MIEPTARFVARSSRFIHAEDGKRTVMCQLGGMQTAEDHATGLSRLHRDDLLMLLAMAPDRLLSAIVTLNRSMRYHNGLNAIVLAGEVLDLRSRWTEQQLLQPQCPIRPDAWEGEEGAG